MNIGSDYYCLDAILTGIWGSRKVSDAGIIISPGDSLKSNDRYPAVMTMPRQKKIFQNSGASFCNPGKMDHGFISPVIWVLLLCMTGCSPQAETPVSNDVSTPELAEIQQNRAPVITSEPARRAFPDTAYIYQAGADDPEAQELSWQLLESPAGIVMDRRSGLLYGEFASPGDHLIRLEVMDAQGARVEQSFTVVVEPGPVISSIPPRYAFSGSIFRYQLHAYVPEQLGLSYTMARGPAGMEFSTDSGLLTWQDPEPGSFEIELTVTNSIGHSATQAFQLDILHEQGLAMVSTPAMQAYVREKYEYQPVILALQETGTRYTLEHSPPGMIVDEATGYISWEPQTEGRHHVEVRVTNEAGYRDIQIFDIEVTSLEKMDLMFNSRIDSLFDNVSSGNFMAAAGLLTAAARISLLPALHNLQPYITGIHDNFEPAVRMMIRGDIAEYIVSGTQAGQQRSFIITFTRNATGEWEIHNM